MHNETVKNRRTKRKFPGPAGLLPDMSPEKIPMLWKRNNVSDEVSKIISSGDTAEDGTLDTISSQNSSQSDKDLNWFKQPPWVELQSILAEEEGKLSNPADTTFRGKKLSEVMNINWIQTKAVTMPVGNRVPYLTAVMDGVLELPSSKLNLRKTQCIQLRDSTGLIEAALDPEIVIAYGKDMRPGTSFALKNVGLMIYKRKLIVTITGKNLIYIASAIPNDDTEDEWSSKRFNQNKRTSAYVTPVSKNNVRLFKFSEFCPEKIIEAHKKMCERKVVRKLTLDQNRSSSSSTNNANGSRPVFQKPTLFSHVQVPITEDSQDIDFNFEDDDEGDAWLGNIDFEDETIAETSNPVASASHAVVNTELSTSHDVQDIATGVGGKSGQDDEDDFDRELASMCDDDFNTNSCELPSSENPPSASTQLPVLNPDSVSNNDFSDLEFEIGNF